MITTKLELDFALDRAIKKSLIEELPYSLNSKLEITFEGQSIFIHSENKISKKEALISIQGIVNKTSSEQELLSRHDTNIELVGEDPFPKLVSNDEIKETGEGQFIYSGDFLLVFEALERRLKHYCQIQDSIEQKYPTLIRSSELINAGYLKSFPQHAYLSSHFSVNKEVLESLESLEPDSIIDKKTLDNPSYVLAPTVCYHCFSHLQGNTLNNSVFSSLNKCHRHEMHYQKISRLSTYWMRELMYFGDQNFVQDGLDDALEFTKQFFTNLNIPFEVVVASDPFFGNAQKKVPYQKIFRLKIEIIAEVYGGEKIAVASFNNHQTSLIESYNISINSETQGFSGCIGWGFERILHAIYSRYGHEINAWPKELKQTLDL